ncbi:SMPD4 [Acanthosepion pharaonis]|uniref:SMPD4 n=1 Tax=Acanthosepion pharaonis TaxID=158019 RepID=A0A812CRW6_ACAPH|nr:SMPD4 [Sepia pharaonis]
MNFHCDVFLSIPQSSGSPETWRSETLIQIFSDFWQSAECQSPGIVQNSEEIYVPTINHIRIICSLVKHLHYFVNSASVPILTSPYYQQTLTPLDQFKKTTVLGIVQKRLYTFLRHAFDWWPLDLSFRLIFFPLINFILNSILILPPPLSLSLSLSLSLCLSLSLSLSSIHPDVVIGNTK